jgi:hypothetical protein
MKSFAEYPTTLDTEDKENKIPFDQTNRMS